MGYRSGLSTQTLAVLAELCATPSKWRHGYGIAKDTGLKSGTLYPVLIRLADRGLVEVGQPPHRRPTGDRRQDSAMSWLRRVMAALLGCSAGLLPADRRDWARALRAEADEVPAGRRRWPGWSAGYG